MDNNYGIINYFYKQFGKLDLKKLFYILAFIVFSSWLADGLSQFILLLFSLFFKQIEIQNILLIFIQLIPSLAFFIFIYKKIRTHLDKLDVIKYTVKEIIPNNLKAIIIFLSKPNFDLNLLNSINSIDDFKKEEIKSKRINWEVPAIIIHKIINDLKKDLKIIYIILSTESKGHFQEFKSFIQKIIGSENIEILFNENPIDFENLELTIDAVHKAYESLNSKGVKNKEILIDITAGQKIQSTAGGFYASSYDRYFCYLSTNTKKLHIFDVIYNFE